MAWSSTEFSNRSSFHNTSLVLICHVVNKARQSIYPIGRTHSKLIYKRKYFLYSSELLLIACSFCAYEVSFVFKCHMLIMFFVLERQSQAELIDLYSGKFPLKLEIPIILNSFHKVHVNFFNSTSQLGLCILFLALMQ